MKKTSNTLILSLIVFTIFVFAIGRVYLRSETTLLGYEVSKLKKHETELLLNKNKLTMKLAKITTKSNLEKVILAPHDKKAKQNQY